MLVILLDPCEPTRTRIPTFRILSMRKIYLKRQKKHKKSNQNKFKVTIEWLWVCEICPIKIPTQFVCDKNVYNVIDLLSLDGISILQRLKVNHFR